VKIGAQMSWNYFNKLDSGFRRNDISGVFRLLAGASIRLS
jgi:hypothetical protein